MAFNRYEVLKRDGNLLNFPSIKINSRLTDKFVIYDYDKTRFDRIAFEIYGDDTYNWVILMANKEYFTEFDISKGSVIRVPYPIEDVLSEVQDKIVASVNK